MENSDQQQTHEQPSRHPARRRPGRAVVLAALTAGALAVGAAGVAVAADSEPTAGPGPGNRRGGAIGMRQGVHGAIRGEFVVPKSGGGYQTIAMQRGTVTKVNENSITLRSADGTTRSYTVTADTLVNASRDGISSVRVDDTVRITAVKDGTTTRALRVVDLSRMPMSRHRVGPRA